MNYESLILPQQNFICTEIVQLDFSYGIIIAQFTLVIGGYYIQTVYRYSFVYC